MTIMRGFVRSLEVRDDGWTEVRIIAVQDHDATRILLLQSPDADLSQAHQRLAKLALLRDALARTLPVEIGYESTKSQGDLVMEITIYPTDSIAGHLGVWWKLGVVIELVVTERGPEKDASPFEDVPDEAMVTLLADDGSVASFRVDLQRPHPGTGRGMLELLAQAWRTRRPVRIWVTGSEPPRGTNPDHRPGGGADAAATTGPSPVIVACGWPVLEQTKLDQRVAFIERIGQRSESFEPTDAAAANHLRVKYTTAPDQAPEGDVSSNGAFVPASAAADVHQDSPLVALLTSALRHGLQVKLGLKGEVIHAVEIVSHLGSAARPIWITFSREPLACSPEVHCTTEPTISSPTAQSLKIPQSVAWRGCGYFNEGVWRFVLTSSSAPELLIDGKKPCVQVDGATTKAHAYLHGLHQVEIALHGWTCDSPFTANIYRIR